ncbi:MAG: hypothetical protein HN952_06175 [Candidatus Cloacimonetes bacterium]|nr:hypothetical protein [Candidatus Cloacimonadota bacterium]
MRYVILPLSEVTEEMINDCLESSKDTLRISTDNYTILKWKGNKPRSLYGIPEITDIKTELKKDEWKEETE